MVMTSQLLIHPTQNTQANQEQTSTPNRFRNQLLPSDTVGRVVSRQSAGEITYQTVNSIVLVFQSILLKQVPYEFDLACVVL